MIYFAYGSLVNRDRMSGLCPAAVPLQTARIPHHSLCFTGNSSTWGGGTATIRLAPAFDLWGVLYEIDDEGRRNIEQSADSDGYVWSFTAVLDGEGARVRAGILIKIRDLELTSPSAAYLEVLKTGWQQWGLNGKTLLSQSSNVP